MKRSDAVSPEFHDMMTGSILRTVIQDADHALKNDDNPHNLKDALRALLDCMEILVDELYPEGKGEVND